MSLHVFLMLSISPTHAVSPHFIPIIVAIEIVENVRQIGGTVVHITIVGLRGRC